LKDHLAQLPFPVVIDHFGRASAAEGPNQEGFDALLDLVKSGRAYVKISAAYRMEKATGLYPDAAAIAQALVAANPDRVVWGSDWPHVNSAYGRGRPLTDIAPPIPVDNPARLYGFEAAAIGEIPTGAVPAAVGTSR
jgi:predicted TIM-barrel fold metal-dependent hydrolase